MPSRNQRKDNQLDKTEFYHGLPRAYFLIHTRTRFAETEGCHMFLSAALPNSCPDEDSGTAFHHTSIGFASRSTLFEEAEYRES